MKDVADSNSESVKRWVIRARLCLRGFKDLDTKDLDSYAGNASRFTQRILVSEAVIRRWDICTTVISKAFVQGVTYEELAVATGKPLREVNYSLPAYCVESIKQLLEWETFDLERKPSIVTSQTRGVMIHHNVLPSNCPK